MYHYITLGSMKIYMTGLGILCFLIVFLRTIRLQSKKYPLIQAKQFLRYFPYYLIGTYFFSTYVRYLIKDFVIIPLNREQLLLYISPYEYTFHFVGIVVWMLVCGWHFFRTIPDLEQKKQRRQTFFHAITLGLIPLWIFLLLGDDFIGKSTDGYFFVSAIRPDSQVAIYEKVFPLWTVLSIGGLCLHIISNIINKKHEDKDYTFTLFCILCIFLAFLLLFQQYPKHLVSRVWPFIFDIKQYLLLLIAVWFFIQQTKHRKRLR